jgi:hypothetical protein
MSNNAHADLITSASKPQRMQVVVDVDRKRQLGIDIAKKKASIIAFLKDHDFSTGEIISILSETDNLGEEKSLLQILEPNVKHLDGASAMINEFFDMVEEFQK